MKYLSFFALLLLSPAFRAQIYFPPNNSAQWETITPEEMGYCPDSVQSLYNYLESTGTDAFLLMKDGKIILERYFGTFTPSSVHPWNSAGKTLTAIAVGIAQQEGYLSIYDTTSHYLGTGWTSLTPEQEEKITIRHQLTMTSGLDDGTGDVYCWEPECLTYKADAGTRWAYHNAPYTLLDTVVQVATGTDLNGWTNQKIKSITGMTGLFVHVDYNNIFFSNARSMARFGTLLLNGGTWNGTAVLNDPQYFQEMTNTSQQHNLSYGYLTWLNGKSSFMMPQSQIEFPGSLMPNAPSDMFAALGKESQLINVVPSTGMVLVRMGSQNTNAPVSTIYNDTIWQYINRLGCTLSVDENALSGLSISPNPAAGGNLLTLSGHLPNDVLTLSDGAGKELHAAIREGAVSTEKLLPGVYFLTISRNEHRKTLRFVIN